MISYKTIIGNVYTDIKADQPISKTEFKTWAFFLKKCASSECLQSTCHVHTGSTFLPPGGSVSWLACACCMSLYAVCRCCVYTTHFVVPIHGPFYISLHFDAWRGKSFMAAKRFTVLPLLRWGRWLVGLLVGPTRPQPSPPLSGGSQPSIHSTYYLLLGGEHVPCVCPRG